MKLRNQGVRPRLTVFRSNRYIYAQIIDDVKGKTLVSASQREVSEKSVKGLPAGRQGKTEQAFALGKLLAQKANKKKISQILFDRGSFAYHGRIKAIADGAREGGLQF